MAVVAVLEDLKRYGPARTATPLPTLAESRTYCRRLARSHYENFVVGSLLLPRQLRQHFYHVYAYCRWADDLADEIGDPATSAQLLAWWKGELENCYSTRPSHPVFIALRETIDEFSIPIRPFAALLGAFDQDQRVSRYANFDQLRDYCRRSADPVGELVLYLGRCYDEERAELSACICTGLQLANFCQDVARDWRRGRLYLPQSTLFAAGCDPEQWNHQPLTPEFRAALAIEVARAESWLRRGLPLVHLVPQELRLDVWLFAHGGLRILKRVRQLNYDVWTVRPRVTKWDRIRLLANGWWQTSGSRPRASSNKVLS